MTGQELGEVGEAFGNGLVLRPQLIRPFDRGTGVKTVPYVGKWNSEINQFTTGTTTFGVGAGIPLHTHNVQESVLVIAGRASVQVHEDLRDVEVGDAVWVPAGVPHRFVNAGDSVLVIYWVYGGRDVTRTIVATGETFQHLSEQDRGATSA